MIHPSELVGYEKAAILKKTAHGRQAVRNAERFMSNARRIALDMTVSIPDGIYGAIFHANAEEPETHHYMTFFVRICEADREACQGIFKVLGSMDEEEWNRELNYDLRS